MTSQAQLITKLNQDYLKIDPNNKIRSLAAKYGFLQRGYTQIQKDGGYRRRFNESSTTIATVAGTREYALPSDLIRLDILIRNGIPIVPTTKKATQILNPNDTQGTPNRYYLYGSYIGFEPIPSQSESILFQYFKRLPTLSSSIDSQLPEDFDDAICAYAAYLACNSVEKTQKASIMLADYRGYMETLMNSYLYDDMNIDFTIDRRGSRSLPRDNVLY